MIQSLPRAAMACMLVTILVRPSSAQQHPAVPFLDAAGERVIDSGEPVSTMKTCAACHDTEYIASHSYHVSLGDESERAARFDALTYDHGDPSAKTPEDLQDWIREFGARHVGGGFATGTEMNCFLCHLAEPADDDRLRALTQGAFAWSPTATLARTGLVEAHAGSWRWNRDAFDETGAAGHAQLGLRAPANSNCGLCHGAVIAGHDAPFFLTPSASDNETQTTGAIFSAGRIRRSGMNIAGKDGLSLPWDVHAERLVACVDCHGSINNPLRSRESSGSRPGHLRVQVQGLSVAEYLRTPSHDLAKGNVSQAQAGASVGGTLSSCTDCHQVEDSHAWLPYPTRHLQSMQCEACHIPRIHAPARESTDWTLLDGEGQALVTYRGVDGDPADPRSLITGYTPMLLPRDEPGGGTRLAPQNLTTVFYWIEEDTGERLDLATLREALFDGASYRSEIIGVLDTNGDGELQRNELRLIEPNAISAIQQALENAGATRPQIRGDIRTYGVHHGIAPGPWATRDCTACHSEGARFNASMSLASYLPGGVTPVLAPTSNVRLSGTLERSEAGGLLYRCDPRAAGLSVLGFGPDGPIDSIGRWAVILTLCGVLIHGGIRLFLHFMKREDDDHGRGEASNPTGEPSA